VGHVGRCDTCCRLWTVDCRLHWSLELPVHIAAAAAVADRQRLLGQLLAELPGLLARPDFPEGLLAHVADEVVGKVSAEADFAIGFDLREIPGDGTQGMS